MNHNQIVKKTTFGVQIDLTSYNRSQRSDTLEFEQLDLKHQAVFEKYKHRGNPLSSVQNFTALYMWKDALGFEIFDAGDILYMRRTQPPVCGFLPPLTLRDEDISKAT